MNHKILFIAGSLNQIRMMHQISRYFSDCDCFFTPFYSMGLPDFFVKKGLLDLAIFGNRFRQQTENYFTAYQLAVDYQAKSNDYDLVFTCQDLIISRIIRKNRIVLVQEELTKLDNLIDKIGKLFSLPGWLAGLSTTGFSGAYDLFFVASEGYRDLFVSKGIDSSKIHVTGIPGFDDVSKYLTNEFPHRNYVLAATSDWRESRKYENRKKFIQKVLRIAKGKQVIFKLHPKENWYRSTVEISKHAPGALIYTGADINQMIANCDVLVTVDPSLVHTGMALGKEVYSEYGLELLKKLTPIQNNGTSAKQIAGISRQCLLDEPYAFTR